MEKADVAIIGGTASIDPSVLKDAREVEVATPYGRPSDSITIGNLDNLRVAIVSRHGKTHFIPPHRINFRANIDALHQMGRGFRLVADAGESMKVIIEPHRENKKA